MGLKNLHSYPVVKVILKLGGLQTTAWESLINSISTESQGDEVIRLLCGGAGLNPRLLFSFSLFTPFTRLRKSFLTKQELCIKRFSLTINQEVSPSWIPKTALRGISLKDVVWACIPRKHYSNSFPPSGYSKLRGIRINTRSPHEHVFNHIILWSRYYFCPFDRWRHWGLGGCNLPRNKKLSGQASTGLN